MPHPEPNQSADTSYSCLKCSVPVPTLREIYAVCERADRGYEAGESEGVTFGLMGGIPFVLPSSFGPPVEQKTGEDVVVPVPSPICDSCWKGLHGGPVHASVSMASLVCFVGGIAALGYLLFDKSRGGTLSPLWSLCVFACALPPYFLADRIRSRWVDRLKQTMRAVPQYDTLLDNFPDLELLTQRPTALMEEPPVESNDQSVNGRAGE